MNAKPGFGNPFPNPLFTAAPSSVRLGVMDLSLDELRALLHAFSIIHLDLRSKEG